MSWVTCAGKLPQAQRECLCELSRFPFLTVSQKLEEHRKHWDAFEALERLKLVVLVRQWSTFREYQIAPAGRRLVEQAHQLT